MLKDIISIEICFENCDVVEVDREHIESFSMSDIIMTIGMCANAVIEHEVAKRTYIELDKHCFGNKTWLGEDLLDRILNFKDITAIDVKFNDGTSRRVGCMWDGDDEYRNSLQKTYITTYDNLIIEISA